MLIVFIICLGLLLEHWKAWDDSVAESEVNCRITGICFAAHGQHTYEIAADRYVRILVFLVFFLAGLFFRSKVISLSVCLTSVFLIFYQFFLLYEFYSYLINTSSRYYTEPCFSLLRNYVPDNWFCF